MGVDLNKYKNVNLQPGDALKVKSKSQEVSGKLNKYATKTHDGWKNSRSMEKVTEGYNNIQNNGHKPLEEILGTVEEVAGKVKEYREKAAEAEKKQECLNNPTVTTVTNETGNVVDRTEIYYDENNEVTTKEKLNSALEVLNADLLKIDGEIQSKI